MEKTETFEEMLNIEKQFGNQWSFEKRAYFHERAFQEATGLGTEIKELFDEMLTYKRRDNLPKLYMKHLLEALEKSTDGNFSLTITWLLNWIKESNRDAINKEIYEFNHENDKDRFQELFKYCTTVHNVFVLHIGSITWKDSVSEEEKLEILDYVDMNYDWKMRVRVRKK